MKRVLPLLLVLACGRHDIVVVELPPNDGGMTMGPQGKNCITASDCPHPGDFCEFTSCAATSGKCRMREALCKPDFDPVCGCNGVTYWNDCLRRGAGQPSATLGQCGSPATCDTGVLCPDPDASCARLLLTGSSCAATPVGTCWVVPKNCPPPTQNSDDAWETCGGGPLVCSGLCAAVRSGQIRRQVTSCP